MYDFECVGRSLFHRDWSVSFGILVRSVSFLEHAALDALRHDSLSLSKALILVDPTKNETIREMTPQGSKGSLDP